eukprot:11865266-Prorocentrum_lima.AAC.1
MCGGTDHFSGECPRPRTSDGARPKPSPKPVAKSPEGKGSEDKTTSPTKTNRPKGSPKGVMGAGGAR